MIGNFYGQIEAKKVLIIKVKQMKRNKTGRAVLLLRIVFTHSSRLFRVHCKNFFVIDLRIHFICYILFKCVLHLPCHMLSVTEPNFTTFSPIFTF